MVDSFVVPDALLARCMGQVKLAQRVVDTFVKQLNEDIPQLVADIRDGRLEEASRLAHRIKGASANVAAEALRADAESLEQLLRDGRQDDARGSLANLETDWQHYVNQTTSFLD
jgi:HPt (histidine-containing phosphotransfer) domain-containing protein